MAMTCSATSLRRFHETSHRLCRGRARAHARACGLLERRRFDGRIAVCNRRAVASAQQHGAAHVALAHDRRGRPWHERVGQGEAHRRHDRAGDERARGAGSGTRARVPRQSACGHELPSGRRDPERVDGRAYPSRGIRRYGPRAVRPTGHRAGDLPGAAVMPAAERSRISAAEVSVAIVAGLVLLAIRPVVAGTSGGPLLVVAILAVLIAMSLSAPIAPSPLLEASLRPSVVLAVRIGAIYPLSGPQSPGGIDEYRGVKLALDLVNADGGLHGRPVELLTRDVPGPDAATAAVDGLAKEGVPVIVGSYGSVISEPASIEASHKGVVFWETGAVGSNPMGIEAAGPEELFFRVPPSGATLGSSAVSFVTDQLAPMLHRSASSLPFAVANVDDTYGSAVSAGSVTQIHALGLPFAGQFPYEAARLDATAVVQAIARAKPDVLFVAAYLADGVALRRAMVDEHLKLV